MNAPKDLNENEKHLMRYIEEHIEEIPSLSSRELARRTFTNPTMVLRFCRKLGFENFNDFKVNIGYELKNKSESGPKVIRDANPLTTNNRLAVLYGDVVSETRNSLSMEVIAAVAGQITQKPYLDFVGTDLNEAVTLYAAHMFANLGKLTESYRDMHRLLYLGLNATPEHLVFLFSKDGTNRRIVQCAKELGRKQVATAALTSASESPLAKECSFVLPTIFDKPFLEMGNIVYTISAQYVMNLLYLQYFSGHYDGVVKLTEEYGRLLYGEK